MSIPLEVLRAYGLAHDAASAASLIVSHIPSLINRTYVVRGESSTGPLVLQRMHPVFGPDVHHDIEAVTTHLGRRQMETPRLIRTRAGTLWTVEGPAGQAQVWRALSYIDGVTLQRTEDPDQLNSAAQLLGRFHAALVDLDHHFVHVRPLHDTVQHLAKLERALSSDAGRADVEAQRLGAAVLSEAASVRTDFSALPSRVIHGDPKISNLLFHRDRPAQARCMIDLDSLGHGYLAYELGDALRSWCNPAGEDAAAVRVDKRSFAAIITGYAKTRPSGMQRQELLSVVDGLQTVSLELASRFASDVIVDAYWGWDPTRFGSRREHNLVRAQGQLALSQIVREERSELLELCDKALEEIV